MSFMSGPLWRALNGTLTIKRWKMKILVTMPPLKSQDVKSA